MVTSDAALTRHAEITRYKTRKALKENNTSRVVPATTNKGDRLNKLDTLPESKTSNLLLVEIPGNPYGVTQRFPKEKHEKHCLPKKKAPLMQLLSCFSAK
eukprot:TRINITY_DN2583_c0_g1_i3.p2 TRINITY_DN2583_c0_g1~~TRINITY_DN2583_c0_g1_i3.p2  ORF type:complete len:100 (-),score=15.98 TRINITY_DN2583_c0_g1_i3:218-517(-)